MQEKTILIRYKEYESVLELGQSDRLLLEKAVRVASGAYAPYSHFNVGAAVRLENGEVFTSANQENAAFPSGLCAERSALFYAQSQYPDIPVAALAVAAVTDGKVTPDPTYPCGACRQVLQESQERGNKPIRVIIGSAGRIIVTESVADLLPFAFDNLPRQ